MHLFHNWETVHNHELENKKGSFEHIKCSVCGKQKIESHLSFFASHIDEDELGFAMAVYSGFQKDQQTNNPEK